MVHESIKGETVSVVAHGVGSGQKTKVAVCKQTPHFAIELESAPGATEALLRRELLKVRGTQREYSSKPLKNSIVKRILLFKR